MTINWPFVSRRRYDQALQQIAQARLELEVSRSEFEHCKRSRLQLVGTLAAAAVELSAARKESDAWRREVMAS